MAIYGNYKTLEHTFGDGRVVTLKQLGMQTILKNAVSKNNYKEGSPEYAKATFDEAVNIFIDMSNGELEREYLYSLPDDEVSRLMKVLDKLREGENSTELKD
ncbi:hypothetical protein [Helicobacter sp. 11S02629-2]|uniref:hypothetical protein n=1 Tax=Helicobacter sp. 11S02629-2 TaxID=1476195 RepID=UPI000BA4EA41|nr:hypothetical protein [Helicobacter sp. 11S02629-2]PAF44165.1 hypothetical protein BKH40_06100 [Helicobacter sp. 11S02629-2]